MKKHLILFFAIVALSSLPSEAPAVSFKKKVVRTEVEDQQFQKSYEAQIKNIEHLQKLIKAQEESVAKTSQALVKLAQAVAKSTIYLDKISRNIDLTNQLLGKQIKEIQALRKDYAKNQNIE